MLHFTAALPATTDWTAYYAGVASLSGTVLGVLGAVIGFTGRNIHVNRRRVLQYGVFASLAELGVGTFTSLSRSLPGTFLLWLIPVVIVLIGLALIIVHVNRAVVYHREGWAKFKKWDRPELFFNAAPIAMYALIVWAALFGGPEVATASAVLWLAGSGLFQAIRYLSIKK